MLFDVQPQPMWVVDAKSLAFLAVNSAAMRLYGYSKEEFLAMTADQIRPEDDIEDLRKAFQDQSRNYRTRVWRHRKKNGDLIQVKVVSFNLDFDGRPATRTPTAGLGSGRGRPARTGRVRVPTAQSPPVYDRVGRRCRAGLDCAPGETADTHASAHGRG